MIHAGCVIETPGGPVAIDQLRAQTKVLALTDGGLAAAPVDGLEYRAAPPELVCLKTAAGRELRLTPEHPVYCRFLGGPPRFDVVLVKEPGLGAALIAGARGLRETSQIRFFYRSVLPEFAQTEEIFLLASFEEEREAILHRKRLNTRFGVPEATGGYRDMDRQEWRRLFLEVDTILRAHELLEALGLDPQDPHWVQRSLAPEGLRRHLQLEALRYRGHWYVEVRRPGTPGRRPLRVEGRAEAERLENLGSYEGLEHVDVDRRFELGWPQPYRRMRAAAVQPGMGIPATVDGRPGVDRVVEATRVPGDGLVYRIDAPDLLGVVTGGLVLSQEGPNS